MYLYNSSDKRALSERTIRNKKIGFVSIHVLLDATSQNALFYSDEIKKVRIGKQHF
jgi:hypothetical protein